MIHCPITTRLLGASLAKQGFASNNVASTNLTLVMELNFAVSDCWPGNNVGLDKGINYVVRAGPSREVSCWMGVL